MNGYIEKRLKFLLVTVSVAVLLFFFAPKPLDRQIEVLMPHTNTITLEQFQQRQKMIRRILLNEAKEGTRPSQALMQELFIQRSDRE